VFLEGGSLIVDGIVTSGREFAGGGPLIKEGSGTLHLTNLTNTYSGPTVVTGGVLRFNSNGSLGNPSGNVVLNGGSLSATASLGSGRNLILAQDSSFEVLSGSTTWSGQITGDHILTKTGPGVLHVTGSTFHDGFVVNQGILRVQNTTGLGKPDGSVTVRNGSQLHFGGGGVVTQEVRLGQATLNTQFPITFLSIQSDPESSYDSTVTKIGAGSLTVVSSMKAGTFQVNQGALLPGSAVALASHQLIHLSALGTSLQLNGFNANIRALSGISGSSVTHGSNTLTITGDSWINGLFAGNISGTGGLVKTGYNTQTLSGANDYSGGTTVSGGQLIFATASSVPVSGLITNTAYTGAGFAINQTFLDRFDKPAGSGVLGLQVNSANNLDLTDFSSGASIGTSVSGSGVTFSGGLTPQGSTYRFAGGYGRLNVASDLSGARSVYAESLRVHLSGNNTFENGATAGSNGVVVFDNAASLPATGSLTALSNGYIGSALPVDQAFLDRFDKANTQGVIGFNANSSNNLDLTGFGSGASLGTVDTVTISGNIIPQGANYRFGGVNGFATGTMTVESNLGGAHGLDIGNINLILAGANTYNGATTVSSGGTVRVDADTRLGLGKLILNGGTYHPAASFASGREIEIIGYGNIRTDSGVTLTQNGNITGNTGSALVANTSTSIITGDGATTGTLTVSNGGVVSPGNSPGNLEVGAVVFGGGGIYDWEIASVSGNHDRISATGTIDITASTLNPFTIRVIGLDGSNNPGFVSDFNMAGSYMWILASGSSVSGFDASRFELDLSQFHNPSVADQFSIGTSGNSLVLNYNAAGPVPEPSGVLLIALGGGALLVRRSRGNRS
jgi:fibronectin-binding autotransporter adhesin